MKYLLLSFALLLPAAMPVMADESLSEEVIVQSAKQPFTLMGWLNGLTAEKEDLPIPGDTVEQWLAMQRDGNMASANPQAATRELREKAAERFLKTYEQQMPIDVYGSGFKPE
jgi:hypothetical protein